jgi:hypothetical protein
MVIFNSYVSLPEGNTSLHWETRKLSQAHLADNVGLLCWMMQSRWASPAKPMDGHHELQQSRGSKRIVPCGSTANGATVWRVVQNLRREKLWSLDWTSRFSHTSPSSVAERRRTNACWRHDFLLVNAERFKQLSPKQLFVFPGKEVSTCVQNTNYSYQKSLTNINQTCDIIPTCWYNKYDLKNKIKWLSSIRPGFSSHCSCDKPTSTNNHLLFTSTDIWYPHIWWLKSIWNDTHRHLPCDPRSSHRFSNKYMVAPSMAPAILRDLRAPINGTIFSGNMVI